MRKTIPTEFVLLVLGIVAVSQAPAWSAEPKPEPLLKWEYRLVTKERLLDLGNKDLLTALNKLGDEGWELVAAEPTYIFKRLKGPTPKQLEEVKHQVLLAQSEVEMQKDRVTWSERMVKKGYLTERHLQAEKARLQAAEVVLDTLERELKAFSPAPKPEK